MSTQTRNIGKYALRERLGQDRMAEIWKAFDNQLQRYVIIKLLHVHLQNDPSFLSHFERAANEIKSLHHPNLLQIHDIHISDPSQAGNVPSYIVMDYIEGQTLADYIRGTSQLGSFPAISDIISILTSIGSAVDYAHQKGLSYCNVRATAIVLDKRHTSRPSAGEPILINYEVPTLLGTFWDARLDTSLPIAPEQAQGGVGDERSDIYSLGVMLYEICTGASPSGGESLQNGAVQYTHQITPPEVLNRQISPALSWVIMRSLAQNPAARFSNVSAMISAAIDAFRHIKTLNHTTATPSPQGTTPILRSSSPVRRNRNALFTALIALLILLVVGAGGLFFLSKPPDVVATNQIVGHAYLESSGQFVENSINGINDELHLILSNTPKLAPGKSYYLWLLTDEKQNPISSIFLGTVPSNRQNIDIAYTTPQHTNLIATTSRLLITEENTNPPPAKFSSDTHTWRYVAEIPQTPDSLSTSPLRYIRLLMVESNKLAAQGLHGGSAYRLLRNTQKVLEWAGSARDEWDLQNASLMHKHFIRILDYIDGSAFVQADLPPGTPLFVNPLLAQYGLVTIVPGDNPESYPPRVSYNVQSFVETANHLSPEKHKLGLETERDIRTTVEAGLQLVRQDAKRLFLLTDDQLLQRSTLSLLNDMVAQARLAYSGVLDPDAGYLKGGALNDYNNIQLIASFDITPYRPSV